MAQDPDRLLVGGSSHYAQRIQGRFSGDGRPPHPGRSAADRMCRLTIIKVKVSMRKRLLYGLGILVLVLSTALVVWLGHFHQRDFIPSNPAQTVMLWAVSTLIFILMVTVGWMLA